MLSQFDFAGGFAAGDLEVKPARVVGRFLGPDFNGSLRGNLTARLQTSRQPQTAP